MSASQAVSPCTQGLNPLKKMNYTFGMVLGVDEFRQEQTYFVGKNHSQYRLAHGYGTVCGLKVQVVTSPVLEVQVSTGVLIDPNGQEIHVQQVMCARLNDWLSNNQTALQEIFGSPPFEISLCVVLCYRECPTDVVPVPGQPCRTQQDAMAPSHIAESFELKLCLNIETVAGSPPASPSFAAAAGLCFRPAQVEEDVIRQFGHLLRRVRITDVDPSSMTSQELENLVRELAPATASLVTSRMVTSPADDSPIYLFAPDARRLLNAMFLVWVTEVRPALVTHGSGCGCGTPAEQCVRLADLNFTAAIGWQVAGSVQIDESRRPYLLETRLLQEFLLSGAMGDSGAGGGAANGIAVVAAGTFGTLKPGAPATSVGPTLNGLTAVPGASFPQFLLSWTGFPAYSNPNAASPISHTYVVKGVAIAGVATGVPYVLQVIGFEPSGILVEILGANPGGFTVEISEISLD